MAAKTTGSGQYAGSLLSLIFQGVTYANFATSASGGFNTLYVSLHTSASALASGNQTTSEAGYTSYSRQSVARTAAAWTVTNNSVSPVATISFPQASGGSETEVAFGIGTSGAGTGQLLYWGTISPTIAVSNGVQPQLTTSSTISEI